MRRIIGLSAFLILILLACNISATPTAVLPGGEAPNPTVSPTDQATETPSPTLTSTKAPLTVSVSVDTNCRAGPGQNYAYLGGLMVGETAVVLGKDATGQYWIISNPDVPGAVCWLWARYATLTGDPSGLPVATPPPTPTPAENAPDPLPATNIGLTMNLGQCFNFDTGQVTAPDAGCDLFLAPTGVFQNRNGAKISGYVTMTAPTRSHCIGAVYEPGDLAVQTDLYMCEITSQGMPGFIVVRAYLGGVPMTGIVFDYWVFR